MAMKKSQNNSTTRKQAVFSTLYAQNYGRVLRAIASRFRDQALAEDATAQAFATAYEKFETFRCESSLYTWVFAIANNAARYSARRRGLVGCAAACIWARTTRAGTCRRFTQPLGGPGPAACRDAGPAAPKP